MSSPHKEVTLGTLIPALSDLIPWTTRHPTLKFPSHVLICPCLKTVKRSLKHQYIHSYMHTKRHSTPVCSHLPFPQQHMLVSPVLLSLCRFSFVPRIRSLWKRVTLTGDTTVCFVKSSRRTITLSSTRRVTRTLCNFALRSHGFDCIYVLTASTQMIIKGRSLDVHHVSRTHRIYLDCFLYPTIAVLYVSTKNKLRTFSFSPGFFLPFLSGMTRCFFPQPFSVSASASPEGFSFQSASDVAGKGSKLNRSELLIKLTQETPESNAFRSIFSLPSGERS